MSINKAIIATSTYEKFERGSVFILAMITAADSMFSAFSPTIVGLDMSKWHAISTSMMLLLLTFIMKRIYTEKMLQRTNMSFDEAITEWLGTEKYIDRLDIICITSDSYHMKITSKDIKVKQIRILLPSLKAITAFYHNTGSKFINADKSKGAFLQNEIDRMVNKTWPAKNPKIIEECEVKYIDFVPTFFWGLATNGNLMYGYYTLGEENSKQRHGFGVGETFILKAYKPGLWRKPQNSHNKWFEDLWEAGQSAIPKASSVAEKGVVGQDLKKKLP